MSEATAMEDRPPQAYTPKSPWPPLQALVMSAAAVGIAFIVAGLAAIAALASNIDLPAALIIGTMGQQVTLIAAALWLSGLRGGRRAEVLALAPPRGGVKSYVLGLLTLAFAVVAMSAAVHALDPTWIKADLKQFSDILSSPVWWAMFPMVGLGAPLAEELLFRGYLFSALARSRFGTAGAAVLTSAGWAAVHSYSIVGVAQVFVIGLIFSWMLLRTGSLRVPIMVHALYNTTLTALMVTEAGKGILTP